MDTPDHDFLCIQQKIAELMRLAEAALTEIGHLREACNAILAGLDKMQEEMRRG